VPCCMVGGCCRTTVRFERNRKWVPSIYIVVYDDMMISNATFFRENVAPKKCCQHFFFNFGSGGG
jgi:hypothetical protein